MDPYSPPKSAAVEATGSTPSLIKSLVGILAFTYLLSVCNSFFTAFAEQMDPLDPFVLGGNVVWLAVVIWIAFDLLKSRSNPQYTFLVLSIVVTCISVIDTVSSMVFAIGLVESICYFVCFIMLKSKSLKSWFQN